MNDAEESPPNKTADMREKFRQLQELVSARGEDVDPAVLERVAALQKQLEELESRQQEQERNDRPPACLGLAVNQLFSNRKAEIEEQLKELADGKVQAADAAKLDLFRLTAVCIRNVTDEEIREFVAGKGEGLQEAHVEQAFQPESEALVLGLGVDDWEELTLSAQRAIAANQRAKKNSQMPPWFLGLMSIAPAIQLFMWLRKKYTERQAVKQKSKGDGKKSSGTRNEGAKGNKEEKKDK